MPKSEQDRAKAAEGEVLDPVAVPRVQMGDRHATSKRSAINPLSGLTAKQEAFALAIVQGHSTADAYRQAYDCENMKDTSIYRQAWELIRHPKVSAYVSQMMQHISDQQRMQAVGLAGFVQERLLQLASDNPDIPKHVQLKALESLGRSVGMFVDRKETKTVTDDSLPELERKLKEKMEALKLVNRDPEK